MTGTEGTKRGKLIVLEGIDKSGKSTLSTLLSHSIPNSTLKRYPNRLSSTGKLLNDYLQNPVLNPQVAHLIFSANRWEESNSIKQDLEAGINVIIDRYSYSGIAYSVAKGLSLDWCLSTEQGLLKPDVVLYLDLDPMVAASRDGFGEEAFENVEFQKRVAFVYEQLWEVGVFKRLDAGFDSKELVKIALDYIDHLDPNTFHYL